MKCAYLQMECLDTFSSVKKPSKEPARRPLHDQLGEENVTWQGVAVGC